MSEAHGEVPGKNLHQLNDNEQHAFASWLVHCEPTTGEFDLFQAQVPLGRTSVTEADPDSTPADHTVGADLTKQELLELTAYTEHPTGFPDAEDISQDGFRYQSYALAADVILIGKQYLDIVEIKTRNQRITGRSDIYEAIGQLDTYTTEFRRDYPRLLDAYELRGFVLAEESTVDITLITSVFEEAGYGFFDKHRGGYVIDHR